MVTVVRTSTLELVAGHEDLREAVHRAVARMRWWKLLGEAESSWQLAHRRPGLLPTRVDVTAEPGGAGPGRLVLTSTSQSFVQGDIFRMYPRMLHRLRRELAAELGDPDTI